MVISLISLFILACSNLWFLALIFLDIALLNILTVLFKTAFQFLYIILIHVLTVPFLHVLFCFSFKRYCHFRHDFCHLTMLAPVFIPFISYIGPGVYPSLLPGVWLVSFSDALLQKKQNKTKQKKQEFCYSLGCSLVLWRDRLHKTLHLVVFYTSIKVLPLLALFWGGFAVVTAVSRAQSISMIFFTSSLPVFCLV